MLERPPWPTEVDNIRAWIERYLRELHTALPARVQTYYPDRQEADVVPVVLHPVPQPDGSLRYEEIPPIPCVPVLHPRTKNAFIHLPVAAGDFVLVICTSVHSEFWRAGDGAVQAPGDLRRHHLANAMCIPCGPFPLNASPSQRLPITDDNKTALVAEIKRRDGGSNFARLTLRPDGEALVETSGMVHLGGTAGEQFVALANKCNENYSALKTVVNTHKHTGVTTGPGTSAVTDTLVGDLQDVSAEKVKAK